MNIFWQERNRKPVERKDLGIEGELIARLAERANVLGGASAPATQRAVALAWFEHLVGDAHQPLHASARVTGFEPKGDHGGNDLSLRGTHPLGPHDCTDNLHGLRDGILVSQRGHDGVDAVAADLQARNGKPLFIGLGNCEGWARESLKLVETKAYPPTLFRRTKPTPVYFSYRAPALIFFYVPPVMPVPLVGKEYPIEGNAENECDQYRLEHNCRIKLGQCR